MQPTFFGADENARNQSPRMTDWTWDGASVLESTGTVAELFPEIPVFSRHPFRLGNEENRSKDQIFREPLKITEDPFPICTVSSLIHLSQALSWIAGTRKTITERLEYVKAIPWLMEPLTATVV